MDSEKTGGLVVAVEKIVAARGGRTQPSDGGVPANPTSTTADQRS